MHKRKLLTKMEIAVFTLCLAYPEMDYLQAYMCQVRNLRYDTWGVYSLDELLSM